MNNKYHTKNCLNYKGRDSTFNLWLKYVWTSNYVEAPTLGDSMFHTKSFFFMSGIFLVA